MEELIGLIIALLIRWMEKRRKQEGNLPPSSSRAPVPLPAPPIVRPVTVSEQSLVDAALFAQQLASDPVNARLVPAALRLAGGAVRHPAEFERVARAIHEAATRRKAAPRLVLGCDRLLDALARPFATNLGALTTATIPGEPIRELLRIGVLTLSPDPQQVLSWAAAAPLVGRGLLVTSGLDGEMHRHFRLPSRVPLFPALSEHWDLPAYRFAQCYGAWLAELFADAFSTVALGPVYGRLLLRDLAPSSEHPGAAFAAWPDERGTHLAEHAPTYLRALFVCRLLDRMGYEEESHTHSLEWRQLLGQPEEEDSIGLPTVDGRFLGVEVDLLREMGERYVDELVDYPWETLGGTSLRSRPGFALEAHESAVFLRGHDPRAVLVRAIRAAKEREPDAGRVLAELAGETASARGSSKSVRVARSEAARPFLDLRPASFRDAMVLDAILR